MWPLRGRITSRYGWRTHPTTGRRSFHEGVDISAPAGAPIKAVREGKVISAGWLGDYGLTVKILHKNGVITRYSHASKLLASEGDLVAEGQMIALVGSTGVSTGPLLDFGVITGGTPVDPMVWLK